jgi:hypothetical protein
VIQHANGKPADGTIVLSPTEAAQIRLALLMALWRSDDVELEAMVCAAYRLLHQWATTPNTGASK